MPPKKESKKSELKKAEKVIEDKTFGLKNKNKSKTVQNFIKGVATQVKQGIIKGGESKRLADEYAEKAAKKKEEENQALLNSLFKAVKKSQEQESSEEEEEEEIEDNGELDLYVDQRDQIYGNRDEEEDEGDGTKKKNRTEITCKFFLDAVEKNNYGWRWVCPNGLECIYRHRLPLGYVLKRDGAAVIIEDNSTLEEKLEEERAQLSGGTPVTLERFLKWKQEKKAQREKEWEEKRQAEAKKSGGKGLNVLSGRALFKYDPTLFQDDLDAAAVDDYEEEKIDEEEEKNEDDNGEQEGEEGEEGDEQTDEKNGKGETPVEGENQVKDTETKAEGETQSVNKKKKKKKKAANKEEEVKINENVFLDADVEIPEDDI